ncbi:MAG: serine/threonine-protein kinase [Gemmatimonadales bacterium]
MRSISKELWATVAPLLAEALELDGDGRAALVARLRQTNPAAADELAALLAAEDDPALSLLDQTTGGTGGLAGLSGQSIGNYTLDRPIGRGGMGSVWLAHRSDGRFDGPVAIKLLNLALVGRAGEERFAQEGRVLGRLNHPNIARLLDAGVTDGQPFLVLEYVEGERIDEFADRRRAPPAERIRLAIQVLDAPRSRTRADHPPTSSRRTSWWGRTGGSGSSDFGMLLLEGRSVGEPTTLTESGGRALTPEFAAPEVVLGDPVSAATDIYSTGVLLFAMLTGRHPTSEGCTTAAAHLQAVVGAEPTRLSEALGRGADPAAATAEAAARGSTADRLSRQYQGDLDNILAKALRKAPEERYQTAAEFREDLQRYLDHLPVRARPDTIGYRARKYLRRNRRSLAAGGLAAASLLGGTIVSVRQMQIANRARARAENAGGGPRPRPRSNRCCSGSSNRTARRSPTGNCSTGAASPWNSSIAETPSPGSRSAFNSPRTTCGGQRHRAVAVLARTAEVADSFGDLHRRPGPAANWPSPSRWAEIRIRAGV